MRDSVVENITNSTLRKSLYHFTRMSNLPAIAHFDALFSSDKVAPSASQERRIESRQVNYLGLDITLNAHLRIAESVMDPATTPQQFRACLNRHVFFWPTKRECLKMMETYMRREPQESFAILELDASSLLTDYGNKVKLSKYDSGSSPRFPSRCSYKKSLQMFLPLNQFGTTLDHLIPIKPSEIHEVLVEDEVSDLSRYLQVIYCNAANDVPEHWSKLVRPLGLFRI